MVDIIKELDENQTLLLVVELEKYNSTLISTMKKMSRSRVCYVTLNRTSKNLTTLFKKNGVKTENVIFIDAITKTVKSDIGESETCYYIRSPGALTELSLAISEFLKYDFDYLVFDAVTNMLIYEKKEPVEKFLSIIINKIEMTKTKALFLSLPLGDQEDLIRETGMFCDKEIDMRKK